MSAKTKNSKAAQKAKFEARKAELAGMPAWQGPRLPIVKPVVEVVEEEVIETAHTIISQYNILPSLGAAAMRAESIGQRAASEKQISYLASLMVKAGHDAGEFEMNSSLILTSMNASKRIDSYLNH